MNIYVITVATHNEGYYDALLESCKRNNINLIILGFNEKWKGFSWRFKLINDYINNLKDNDIILFIDAFDVIILKDIEEIKKRFINNFTKPIVISHESTDSYINKILYKISFNTNSDIYCNAGTYIGYVYALKEFYNLIKIKYKNLSIEEFNKLDDQYIFNNIYNNNKDFVNKYIEYDINNIIFLVKSDIFRNFLYSILNIEYKNNIKKIININACILHGPCNLNMDDIIIYYKLPLVKKRNKYFYNTLLYFSKHIFNRYALIIYIIIIIIIIIYNIRKKYK
jgi:hypothetical protein